MKTAIILAGLAAGAQATALANDQNVRQRYEAAFYDHLQKYDLQFDGAEFVERLQVFIENDMKIVRHNAGNHTYKLAHNLFSHLTVEEWKDMYTGIKRPNLRPMGANKMNAADFSGSTPASVDWVAKGAVTPVKDQGQCGSCWSFSTTGALEGAYAINNGKLVSFSEQQLVDCSTLNAGCNGGMMDRAFRFIKNNGGLCTEADYPYVSGVTQTAGKCQETCKEVAGSTVSSWTDVENSDAALTAALAQQPVSVAVDAEEDVFMFYESGVVTANCGTTLDHGVLAVGYGTTSDGIDYFKVKNSWGPDWGSEGFIYIGRNTGQKGGMCGITSASSFPSL